MCTGDGKKQVEWVEFTKKRRRVGFNRASRDVLVSRYRWSYHLAPIFKRGAVCNLPRLRLRNKESSLVGQQNWSSTNAPRGNLLYVKSTNSPQAKSSSGTQKQPNSTRLTTPSSWVFLTLHVTASHRPNLHIHRPPAVGGAASELATALKIHSSPQTFPPSSPIIPRGICIQVHHASIPRAPGARFPRTTILPGDIGLSERPGVVGLSDRWRTSDIASLKRE
ncbi:hypothetical protein PSHT_05768 [Puccinia striiformis]|uniref:Uncharacterized protein n=1 Tax=Puccinia striiformis TaxID=27350 RepID=A0A2S4W9L4_9BASI|nr:hypothetical protein PSHT_05768 [Puccinia striiformis]